MGGPGEICLPLNIAFAPSTWVAVSLSLAARWPRGIFILRWRGCFCSPSSSIQEQPLLSPVLLLLLLLFLVLLHLLFLLPVISLCMRDDIGGTIARKIPRERNGFRERQIGKNNERYCYAVINRLLGELLYAFMDNLEITYVT